MFFWVDWTLCFLGLLYVSKLTFVLKSKRWGDTGQGAGMFTAISCDCLEVGEEGRDDTLQEVGGSKAWVEDVSQGGIGNASCNVTKSPVTVLGRGHTAPLPDLHDPLRFGIGDCRLAYDGKGNYVVRTEGDLDKAAQVGAWVLFS
jgi:hypothetical protein